MAKKRRRIIIALAIPFAVALLDLLGYLLHLAFWAPSLNRIYRTNSFEVPPTAWGVVWREDETSSTAAFMDGGPGSSKLFDLRILRPDERGRVELPNRLRFGFSWAILFIAADHRHVASVRIYGSEGPSLPWIMHYPKTYVEHSNRNFIYDLNALVSSEKAITHFPKEAQTLACDLIALNEDFLASSDPTKDERERLTKDLERFRTMCGPPLPEKEALSFMKSGNIDLLWRGTMALRLREADDVSELADLLRSDNPQVRRGAAIALAGRQAGAAKAEAALAKASADSLPTVRDNALIARGVAGVGKHSILPDLQDLINKEGLNACVRVAKALNPNEEEIREAAIFALKVIERFGDTSKRPVVIEPGNGLRWDPEKYNMATCFSEMPQALARMGPSVATYLSEVIDDPSSTVAQASCAINAVGYMGQDGAAAAPALKRAIKDKDTTARGVAAWSIGRLGLPASEVLPLLLEVCADPHHNLRMYAVNSLGEVGSAEGTPCIVKALHDEWQPLSNAACDALAKMKTVDERALKEMVPMLHDPNPSRAYKAFLKIGSKSAPVLIVALKDPDYNVRANAAKILGEIGPEAAIAIPALSHVLETDDAAYVSAEASRALGKMGKAAVQPLMRSLTNARKCYRPFVAEALGKIGPDAAEAIPAIRQAMAEEQDKNKEPYYTKAISQIEGR